jgi:beta-1,4-mannosyl-glycoprotein beta-1,4-N-acetylglucosaminyltransferase
MDAQNNITPTVSIVIGTYTRYDKLKECLASIQEWIDPCEVIVVANGAPPVTREIVTDFASRWTGTCKFLGFDDPLGYPKAYNAGIRKSSGEYVVLLNDDALFLPQPKNECINVMLKPMLADPTVGITGPLEEYDPNSNEQFLIFFCAMVRRKVFDSVGLLDETFKYFGEDTDLCIKARRAGWKVVRVPEEHPTELKPLDPNTTTLEPWKHDKVHTGMFHIFHDAESTIGNLPDSEEVLRESRAILKERYGKEEVNPNQCKCGAQIVDGVCIGFEGKENCDGLYLWRAALIDGWFGESEGAWLASQVKALPKGAKVGEIGSWHGRSSRFIADNLPEDGQVWCCDTWNGSSGEPEMHGTAHWDRGDHAFQWWWCNLQEHIVAGRVVPVRMFSENAAHTISHLISKGQMQKFDLIFVDGDHSEEGIKIDVEAWLPLLKEGGLICGHDYYKENEGPYWVHVRQFVEQKFPEVQKAATSLWWIRPEKINHAIFDCFLFSDELDLLETRLTETDEVVDRWVIAESVTTHSGIAKPLYLKESFEREPERWAKWINRITHIVVADTPAPPEGANVTDAAWMRERWQRDSLMKGLTDCKDDDIILIGDADEIPSAEAIRSYDPAQGLCRLKQRLLYCYANLENKEGWDWLKIAPYRIVKELSPCGVRYPPAGHTPIIENGGWHFSFMGNVDAWIKKLESTAHQEYNKPEYKDREVLMNRVLSGQDLLGREGLYYEFVDVDDTYPKFIRDNIDRFKANGFIHEVDMHAEAKGFIAQVKRDHPEWFYGMVVLEVGSLNVNGSAREFFHGGMFHGIDLAEGDGVDAVKHVTEVTGDGLWDVVISTEALEHDEKWRESIAAMFRLVKPGGALIITCAGPGRPEHGTKRTETKSSPFTTDYYRNISTDDFISVIPMEDWAKAELTYGRGGQDLYFWGIKPQVALDTSSEIVREEFHEPLTVTAEVSTKDRYTTTLPLTISAIINQTRKPERLVIYDDSENRIPPEKLIETSPFSGLFVLCHDLGIQHEIFETPREGQVKNHQHALDCATTDLLWRIDDDEIPEPNCLENLLKEMKDGVGAVAGLVHHPGNVSPLPPNVDGSLNDLFLGVNIQWYNWETNGKGKT